ncbi:acyltransferase family protein [Demequina gelatinilytica]|uniref:acyltransferase family protein n=1 Tax=Demequina gelatinilytica TaxID=1638980 RepID=UPI0009E4788B|nr:acyltransferase [Demequina gelatinilytica]
MRTGGIRLDSLTGLRFVAALAVFLTHALPRLPADNPVGRLAQDWLTQGRVGVSFFFILSGFVLMWSRRPDDAPRAFYRKRAARILPVYWLSQLASFPVAFAISGGVAISDIVLRATPAMLGIQSWFPDAAIYHAGNQVSWSVADELFFYLMFPVLAVVVPRARPRRALLVVSVAAIVAVPAVVVALGSGPVGSWAVYILPLQRIAEFVIGMALAHAMLRGWRPPVGLRAASILSVAAYLAAGAVPEAFGDVSVTLAPLVLLIAAAAAADLDGASSPYRSRGLVVLGDWSYSFYLAHSLILVSVSGVVDKALPGGVGTDLAPSLLAIVGALVASVAAAGAAYTWVEKPLERRLRGREPVPARVRRHPADT